MLPPFIYSGSLELKTTETPDSYLDYLQHKLDKAGAMHIAREEGFVRFRDTRVNLIFAFSEPLSGITSAVIRAKNKNGNLLVKYEMHSWLVGTISLVMFLIGLITLTASQTTGLFEALVISIPASAVVHLSLFLPSYLYLKKLLQEGRSRAG